MIETGVLTPSDPVELLDGWLVEKMPKNPRQRSATWKTRRTLEQALPPGWFVNVQDPITTETSEPEPDVTVVRGDPTDYADRHPGPADTPLVVEVADSSLAHDRSWKRDLYARANVRTYWIVHLVDHVLEVFTDPTPAAEFPTYTHHQILSPGQNVTLDLDHTRHTFPVTAFLA